MRILSESVVRKWIAPTVVAVVPPVIWFPIALNPVQPLTDRKETARVPAVSRLIARLEKKSKRSPVTAIAPKVEPQPVLVSNPQFMSQPMIRQSLPDTVMGVVTVRVVAAELPQRFKTQLAI